ncbi:MAG: NAD(P)H-dependent glycerol-3-phosphate dehydrogenase [Candidatus Nanopelagicaceae bacterium]
MRIAVLGSGAWGSTLAMVASDAGHDVIIWGRNGDVIEEINAERKNSRFLGEITLPETLRATTSITEALDSVDLITLAIPAQSLRENLHAWREIYPKSVPTVSTLKGIEVTTHLRMTEVLRQEIDIEESRIGFITGPNLAGELALRQPAGAVAASVEAKTAAMIASAFKTEYFRVYTSRDILGCELAAALKNVVALAVGIVVGMGFGENTQAMIITRGLNEVTRLGVALGADPLTFAGLAGMGDLVATCQSSLSRNRSFGEAIGKTGNLNLVRETMGKTVEGVASSSAVVEMAHMVGVEIPIIEAVAEVVSGKMSPAKALETLSEIDTGEEIDLSGPV